MKIQILQYANRDFLDKKILKEYSTITTTHCSQKDIKEIFNYYINIPRLLILILTDKDHIVAEYYNDCYNVNKNFFLFSPSAFIYPLHIINNEDRYTIVNINILLMCNSKYGLNQSLSLCDLNHNTIYHIIKNVPNIEEKIQILKFSLDFIKKLLIIAI